MSLSKSEMASAIVEQQEEIDRLKKQVSELTAKLEEKELRFENVGSLAEVSAIVNDLFAAAQATADTYLENIKSIENRSQETLTEVQKQAEGVIAEAENVAQKRIAAAEEEATRMEIEGREIVAEAERTAQKRMSDADLEIEERWKVIEERLLTIYESHQGLREMVEAGLFAFPKGKE